ncbi:MAG TPA: AtpZ/AtpI family protein [Tepidisphaeraceae bacterium]|nr:AtpZ/AtpI family protein [Tepidisphaeraceae bacterium]
MASNDQSDWGRGLTMGLELGVGVGLGALVGTWLDRRYGFGPWGVAIGTTLGFISGMYLLIKEALRLNKK